jgi:hypothetical protein
MSNIIPLFKSWVPEWLIKITLFIVLLPSLVLFFLPLANINAAAGFYGIESFDVQYTVVLFYAGYTSFFSLEKRFFNYLATKEYFFIITFIQIITSYACFISESLIVIFILRFIQGMAFTCTVNLSLSLIYSRLRSQRAREVSYSIFFGMLICMIPFNNFITADLIDSFNFNTLYKVAMFSYVPSLILIGILMNNVRLNIKFPLYKLDWASFVIYAAILCLLGYILVYGQQYYWFSDKKIALSTLLAASLLALHILRQFKLKRPYFDLSVLKYRNFKVGAFLLFILYICRFASGITSTYFSTVLGLDPIHISYITLFNILGIILGVITSCVMVLQHRSMRLIWIYGFLMLLVYHSWMFFLFNTQANESEFFSPLAVQGLGIGMLITPLIVFMISSVPARLSSTAAGICLFVRCFGFYASIALINYFELLGKSQHYNTFQDNLNNLNPVVLSSMLKQRDFLIHKGLTTESASQITNKLLVKHVDVQGQIRFAMDYFEMISWLLVFTLLLISMFPYINRTIVYLRKDQPAPF